MKNKQDSGIALFWPPLEGVEPVGMRTLGIFVWSVVWWVTEPVPIPVTSFLAMALLVVFGVQSIEGAFSYWANWINIFFIGAFMIAHAMSVHGLPRRLAYRMMASPLLGGSPWRLLVAFSIGTAMEQVAVNSVE